MYFRLSRLVSVLLGVLIFSSTWAYSGENAVDHPDAKVARPTKPATFYKIQAGIEGEIFPVFANYASPFQPGATQLWHRYGHYHQPGKRELAASEWQ